MTLSPIQFFCLVLCIIFLMPAISRRLHIPNIFGLIVSGIIIGPSVLNLLDDVNMFTLWANVGLMYLMFLASLEIDMFRFKPHRSKSVGFGLLTCLIPFVVGFVVAHGVLQYNLVPSLWLACMFSTHTLISYPIAGQLNITKTEPVMISIGATIIADILALLFITVLIQSSEGEFSIGFGLKMILALLAFVGFILWLLPKFCRWFFTHVKSEEGTQYMFVLAVLFLCGALSEAVHVEPIVGAFLCGIALNRVIPHDSILLNRTVFIGNAVFIPFFLISIGMMIDVSLLFAHWSTWEIVIILIAAGLLGKWLAAFVFGKIFAYRSEERNLLFGLTSSRAAATIAIASVGYRMGILDDQILNATVLIVLFSCLVSTYYTEYAGRKVALRWKEDLPVVKEEATTRIVVALVDKESDRQLMDVSFYLASADPSPVDLYPLFIEPDETLLASRTATHRAFISECKKEWNQNYRGDIVPIVRLDVSRPSGVTRAAKEIQASYMIVGCHVRSVQTEYILGSTLDLLISEYHQMILVSHQLTPMKTIRRLVVYVAEYAQMEEGFLSWVHLLLRLQKRLSAQIFFLGNTDTLQQIEKIPAMRESEEKEYRVFSSSPDLKQWATRISDHDIFVAVSARPRTVSYNRTQMLLMRALLRYFADKNFWIIYPHQTYTQPSKWD